MMRTGAGLRRIVSSAKSHCGCGFSALDPEASLHPFVKSGEKAAWRGADRVFRPGPTRTTSLDTNRSLRTSLLLALFLLRMDF